MPHPAVSTPKQSDFLAVPESPVVYWLRPKFFDLLASGNNSGFIGPAVRGLGTGDDNRFLRFFWEAGLYKVDKWKHYCKGGGYSKWFGIDYIEVDWEWNGAREKSVPNSIIPSEYLYFRDGLYTYSDVARGSMAGRSISQNHIIGDKGPGIFAKTNLEIGFLNSRLSSFVLRAISPALQFRTGYLNLLPVSSYLNYPATLVDYCLTLKRQLVATDLTERSFTGVVTEQERLDAVAAVLHTLEGINELEVFAAYGVAGADLQAVLDETGTPAGWFPLLVGYDALPVVSPSGGSDLPPEGGATLPQEVPDYLAGHTRIAPPPAEPARIKARLRALYEAGPGAKPDEADDAEASGDADDEAETTVSGAHIPIPTETFLEELAVKLQLHPISIYWLLEELRREGARCKPEEQRLLEDRLSVLVLRLLGHRWPRQIEAGEPVPPWADPDGIIPLSGGTGEPTLAERLRARLRADDGDLGAQRTEALLAELTGHSLDEWLRRAFFKRHVRQFKYRPIAWQLASDPSVAVPDAKAKKRLSGRRAPAFECLVFYHACDGDVLARIRTQYVEPLLRGARQQREHARRAQDDTGEMQATLRIQELEAFARRLQQVAERGFACAELDRLLAEEPLDRWSGDGYLAPSGRDALARQEQGWRVDLNDGVRVNLAPVQLAGLLASEVLKAADARKAPADRARWRSDERRWVRAGKLPRCGWLPEAVPESAEWTRLAPQRAAEQARLDDKRRAVREQSDASS